MTDYTNLINTLRQMANKSAGLLMLTGWQDRDGLPKLYPDAADAIEELSKPRWIPVTERLPEKYHQVLVYGKNGFQIDYYAGAQSVCGNPMFMISEAKATHWMPLPQPPKEETE